MPVTPKSLFSVSIASKKGRYFCTEMGSPDDDATVTNYDFGSLFGYHYGAYRFKEREFLGSKNAPRGDHFGSLFGYNSGAYRFKEREFM